MSPRFTTHGKWGRIADEQLALEEELAQEDDGDDDPRPTDQP